MRQYEIINEPPEELEYLSEYASFEINKIDLDGDNNSEYIICYTYEKEAEGTRISIVKYNDGSIIGEAKIEANLMS